MPEQAYVPNLADYDVILLGYCNWWASIPAPVRSFLKHDDFSGKTIVPFCSMGGGRFGQTISAIAKVAPESVILKGLDVTYSSYDRTAIRSWLDGISQYQQTFAIRSVKQGNMNSDVFYSLNGQKVKEPHRGTTSLWIATAVLLRYKIHVLSLSFSDRRAGFSKGLW